MIVHAQIHWHVSQHYMASKIVCQSHQVLEYLEEANIYKKEVILITSFYILKMKFTYCWRVYNETIN